MLAIGIDLGTSSVKLSVIDCDSLKTIAHTQYPETEAPIHSPKTGWAEQNPQDWWSNTCHALKLTRDKIQDGFSRVEAIGIAYQMHGLVMVDEQHQPLGNSIIWCDSRAVSIGDKAFVDLGEEYCMGHLLNSPGNFTASKLAWVRQNKPEVFSKIYKIMLPGDYIAMKLSGKISTSIGGLSEAVLWDFKNSEPAYKVLDYFGIPKQIIPDHYPNISSVSHVSSAGAKATGINEGTAISYRAGDQTNNALSLNVMKPGQIAATGGTSGVIYAVSETVDIKPGYGFNAFTHLNYSEENPHIGNLMCINGAGSMYAWIRKNSAGQGIAYSEMEKELAGIQKGSDGLFIFPFGNGAERILHNLDIGCSMEGLNFVRHGSAHLYRAALEGIAFAFRYGIDKLRKAGITVDRINAGFSNLFLSATFVQCLADLAGCPIYLFETDGAKGAALGAVMGYTGELDIEKSIELRTVIKPGTGDNIYAGHYARWKEMLEQKLDTC